MTRLARRCLQWTTLFGAAAVLTQAEVAAAATQTIRGTGMVVEDPLPGINPSKRRVLVKAYEKLSPDSIVGDPIANGATLQVVVNGATSTTQTFTLPAGPPPISIGPGWVGKSIPGSAAKYVYIDKNGEATPVVKLGVSYRAGRSFVLKALVDAQGNNGPVDAVPGNPTTDLGVVFTIVGGDSYCVLFGGAAGGIFGVNSDEIVKVAKPTGEGCPVPAP